MKLFYHKISCLILSGIFYNVIYLKAKWCSDLIYVLKSANKCNWRDTNVCCLLDASLVILKYRCIFKYFFLSFLPILIWNFEGFLHRVNEIIQVNQFILLLRLVWIFLSLIFRTNFKLSYNLAELSIIIRGRMQKYKISTI